MLLRPLHRKAASCSNDSKRSHHSLSLSTTCPSAAIEHGDGIMLVMAGVCLPWPHRQALFLPPGHQLQRTGISPSLLQPLLPLSELLTACI